MQRICSSVGRNNLRPVCSSACSGSLLISSLAWSGSLSASRRWLGSRRVLEPGAASVPGVCSGIELRVQVPPNRIDKGRTRREGPFSFWGICVCACVSGAPSLSSILLSALFALNILAFLLVMITLPLRASLLPHLLLINTLFVKCIGSFLWFFYWFSKVRVGKFGEAANCTFGPTGLQ